jgi:hypothetical protein
MKNTRPFELPEGYKKRARRQLIARRVEASCTCYSLSRGMCCRRRPHRRCPLRRRRGRWLRMVRPRRDSESRDAPVTLPRNLKLSAGCADYATKPAEIKETESPVCQLRGRNVCVCGGGGGCGKEGQGGWEGGTAVGGDGRRCNGRGRG